MRIFLQANKVLSEFSFFGEYADLMRTIFYIN